MNFLIADSFTTSLGKLNAQEQKAAKTAAFDMQLDPSKPGLQMHRLDRAKDPNFWSARVNSDIRIIVHQSSSTFLLVYVDHHDDAYDWAARRRIEKHPATGAAQLVEVRETVREQVVQEWMQPEAEDEPKLFDPYSDIELLDLGVPRDWLQDVRNATDSGILALLDHLPAEAGEALLNLATGTSIEALKGEAVPEGADPFQHPDAKRRFRTLEDVEELARAMDAPWEQWVLYLHPTQREIVDRDFDGSARVCGSAGTGKTVVVLHRAARHLKQNPQARVLLTSFSAPLSQALQHKLSCLLSDEAALGNRVQVADFASTALSLFELVEGYRPKLVDDEVLLALIESLNTGTGFEADFILSEWRTVVDAWQVPDLDAYANVPRMGRKHRLGAQQRARLWPVFTELREALNKRGLLTEPMVMATVEAHYADKPQKPFQHILVDEAQDLSVATLRMLAALKPDAPNGLFFAGDLGQRIFQEPFSWAALGVDVRGRSFTLRVNYRTSHQIRQQMDRLLPTTLRDLDEVEEERNRTVSVFNGPNPKIQLFDDEAGEVEAVSSWLKSQVEGGTALDEIGIFVRSEAELQRARNAASKAGYAIDELTNTMQASENKIAIGKMHLAKGLEFKAVAVMACDEDVLPLLSRIEDIQDESDLMPVFETERHLLYVACTRARENLLVTGIEPGSEFLEDLGA